MINANFLNGFWQGLALPVQILRYFLLLPIAVIGSLFCILFSPVLALFVDGSGNLPWWLKDVATVEAVVW